MYKALRDFAQRNVYMLATKVFNPASPTAGPNENGLSRKHIMSAIDASLQRLGTYYVELYQIHRWNPNTPIEETMEGLHDVVKASKARFIRVQLAACEGPIHGRLARLDALCEYAAALQLHLPGGEA